MIEGNDSVLGMPMMNTGTSLDAIVRANSILQASRKQETFHDANESVQRLAPVLVRERVLREREKVLYSCYKECYEETPFLLLTSPIRDPFLEGWRSV